MSLLPFWALNVSVALLSMQSQRVLGFHQKYLNLCFEDEWSSNMFGMTWGWVIYDIIFGWTIPNEIKMINIFSIQVLPSACLFQERNHISVRSVERVHEPAQHETAPPHSHWRKAVPLWRLRTAFPLLQHAQSPQGEVLPGQQPHEIWYHQPCGPGPYVNWYGLTGQSVTQPPCNPSRWGDQSPPGQVALATLRSLYRRSSISPGTVFHWKG